MTTQHRPIRAIALDIIKSWQKPYFGAIPYLTAMRSLNTLEDRYFEDDAKSIILYFLANAGTYRGEDAKRFKAELKQIVEEKKK